MRLSDCRRGSQHRMNVGSPSSLLIEADSEGASFAPALSDAAAAQEKAWRLTLRCIGEELCDHWRRWTRGSMGNWRREQQSDDDGAHPREHRSGNRPTDGCGGKTPAHVPAMLVEEPAQSGSGGHALLRHPPGITPHQNGDHGTRLRISTGALTSSPA